MKATISTFYQLTKAAICGTAVLLVIPSAQAQNLFVSDSNTGDVFKFDLTQSPPAKSAYASVPGSATGIIIDGSGNLFVAEISDLAGAPTSAIYKIPPSGTPILYATGSWLLSPQGLALDSAGNLYVADANSENIYEIPPGGGSHVTYASLAIQGFINDLAFDGAGNLYVAGGTSTDIYQIPPGGLAPGKTPQIFSGGAFNNPWGLALDSVGNLWVSDAGQGLPDDVFGVISEIPSGGGKPVPFATSGLNQPKGLVFDNAGNLYVADFGSGNVYKYDQNRNRTTIGTTGSPVGVAIAGGSVVGALVAPVAASQSVTVEPQTLITLKGSDPNSPPHALTYYITSLPSLGSLLDQNGHPLPNPLTAPYSLGTFPVGTSPTIHYLSTVAINDGSSVADSFEFNVAFQAAGSTYSSQPATVTMTVECPDITISPSAEGFPWQGTALPAGSVNTDYSENNLVFMASDANSDTFTWQAVGLPSHMSLDADTGFLSGVPTTPGTYPVTILASSLNGCAQGMNYSLTVTTGPGFAPTAYNESSAAVLNKQNLLVLTATDPNAPPLPLTYTLETLPSLGSLTDPQSTDPTLPITHAPYTIAGGPYPSGSEPTLLYSPTTLKSAGQQDIFSFVVNNGAALSSALVTNYVYNSASGLEVNAVALFGQGVTVNVPPLGAQGGVTATLLPLANGPLEEGVTAAGFISPPGGDFAGLFTGQATYIVLQVSPQTSPGDGYSLTTTFYAPNTATPPKLYFIPSGGTIPELVSDGHGNPIPAVADSEIAGYSFTLTFDDSSTTPTVSQLNGESAFGMGTIAPPVAYNQSVTALLGGTSRITLTANDFQPLPLTYDILTLPIGSLVDPVNNHTITSADIPYTLKGSPFPAGTEPQLLYTPASVGFDPFQFQVASVSGLSFPAVVNIKAVNASGNQTASVSVGVGLAASVGLPPASSQGGVTSTLQNAGATSETITATSFASAPNGFVGFFAGQSAFVDLQVLPQTSPPDGDTLTATFYLPDTGQLTPPPVLYFNLPGFTTGSEPVLDDLGNQISGTYNLAINGYSFAVTFNDGSTNTSYPNTKPVTAPAISQLTETLFGMGIPAQPPTRYTGNPLPPATSYAEFDGDPPLVIIGEYAAAGPLATSPVEFASPGTISDIKLFAQNWNLAVYVLEPTLPPPSSGEQTFQVVASDNFKGSSPQAAVQTLIPQITMNIEPGDLLAFAGLGPPYNNSDALNSDATYESSTASGSFTATPPGGSGTEFTVGLHGNKTVTYDYISDVFGNQGRKYAIGADVSPAKLSITWPNPADIVYGTALGAAQLDATANIAGTFTYSPSAGRVLEAGASQTLTLTFTADDTADYPNPVSQTATINVAPLPVILAGSMQYAGTSSAAANILTVANSVGSDIVTVASGNATLAGPNTGPEPITSFGTLTLGGAQRANYTLTGASGAVSVGQANLLITAQPQTITYGAAVPATTVSYSGFVNGETAVSLATQPTILSLLSGVVAAGNYPGNYMASGAVAPNYAISYAAGTLMVKTASLIISANGASRAFGAPNPMFTGTIMGLENGDNITATYSSPAGDLSPPGSYSIIPTPVDPNNRLINYALTLNNGVLLITFSASTIVADPSMVPPSSATSVTFEFALPPDPLLIPGSVNLQQLVGNSWTAEAPQMFDDGTHGDLVAGDNIYTVQALVKAPDSGLLTFRASYSEKGKILRVFSPEIQIRVQALPDAKISGELSAPETPSGVPTVSLKIATLAGVSYVVETTMDLTQPVWTLTETIQGDGTVRTISVKAGTDSRRFYRVRPK